MSEENLAINTKTLKFRLTLRIAARAAKMRGKISAEDFNTIIGAIDTPVRKTPEGAEYDIMSELDDQLAAKAQYEGVVTAGTEVGSIDWSKLLSWLGANLPAIIAMIIQIMALFGV